VKLHIPKLLAQRAEAAEDKAELLDFYHDTFDSLIDHINARELELFQLRKERDTLTREIERTDRRVLLAVGELLKSLQSAQ
jgi:hypothetical protein